jgi:ribonucleases P/MRP protein subunit RPP40
MLIEATTNYAAANSHQVYPVKCHSRRFSDVRIPQPTIPPKPTSNPDNDDLEDWNDMVVSLFEWVGMACLGSQR